MTDRSAPSFRKNRVRRAVVGVIEALESRDYLTGVVLAPPVNTTTASINVSPVFANLADFNGDGKGDLFVANSTNSVSVLLGNGDGSFGTTPATIPVGGTPIPLATGDFNGDGNVDMVAGTTGTPGNVSIILGDGHGHFGAATNIPALASNHGIAVGHFVNGGPLDVISVSNSSSNTNNAALIIGNGQGGEATNGVTFFSLPFGSVSAVAVGDFNHDGNLDFVVANQLNNSVSVFLGNGAGTFQPPQTFATGLAPTSLVVDDFNGDGKIDIITANSTGGNISFLAGKGDGTFAAPVNSTVMGSAVGGGPLKVREANINNDSKPDLAVLLSPGSSGDATLLLGNGDGTFHTGTVIATGGQTRDAIAAGDLDGDGSTDFVVTNASQISSLLNITNADVTPPTAAVDGTQAAGSSASNTYDFTVDYADNTQVDAATIGANNLVVTFPDGVTTEAATAVSMNLGNAASLQAVYQITFPANLTSTNNGVYTVSLGTSPVTDAKGNKLTAISPNTFTLSVTQVVTDTTPPTASVDATQAPATTQTSLYNFTVTYMDNVAVDASTLGNGNLTVTAPGGTVYPTTLINAGAAGTTVQATYQINFGRTLTSADTGSYLVNIAASSVKDTTGNAVLAGNIGALALTVSGSTAADTTPPTAAVDAAQAAASSVSNVYNFTVTYSDNVSVDSTSLSNSNLTVTYPDASVHNATLVNLGVTGPVLHATYQITFPANITSANNGTYQVTLNANTVKDTSGNFATAGGIGSFMLAVSAVQPPPAPTGDFLVSAPTGKLVAAVVGGSRQLPLRVKVTNNTAGPISGVVTVTLYTSGSTIHDSSAVAVARINRKVRNLKGGKGFTVVFRPFTYPTTPGTIFLVADAALNSNLDSTDGATTSIQVAKPFVDGNAVAGAPTRATIVAGKRYTAFVTVQNIGNVPLRGVGTVDVGLLASGSVTPTTIATGVRLALNLQPSKQRKIPITFVPASLPTSGTYTLVFTIHAPGDNNAVNDVVMSAVTVSV